MTYSVRLVIHDDDPNPDPDQTWRLIGEDELDDRDPSDAEDFAGRLIDSLILAHGIDVERLS